MKNVPALTATFLGLLFGFQSQAQITAPSLKKIQVTELSFMPAVYGELNLTSSISDFNALAPNSQLLPDNYNDYDTHGGTDFGGGATSSILLGIKFLNKEGNAYKANPILRVGLTYKLGSTMWGYASKEISTPYDTLISQSTGELFPVDSVTTIGYQMDYMSQQIKLDVAAIFRTDPKARWSLFSGFGASFGTTINARTQIHRSEENSINQFQNEETNSKDAYYGLWSYEDVESEQFNNKNYLVYSAYIPVGLDFRIANKHEFWKKLHLFYEIQSTLNITPIPELRTLNNVAFQHGMGVKLHWD